MRVLQLYYKLPFPMHDGGAYSIYSSSLSLLSQDIELTILAMNLLKEPGNEDLIPRNFITKTRFKSVDVDNRIKPVKAAACLFSNRSYFAERFISKEYSTNLIALLQYSEFDIVQLEHLYMCQYIEIIRKYTKAAIILKAQNIENQVWQQYASKSKNPFIKFYFTIESLKLCVLENKMSSMVDAIITLTEKDATYFKSVTKQSSNVRGDYKKSTKIRALPLGIIHDQVNEIKPAAQAGLPAIYHLGSMDWRPNAEGVKWFIKRVLPLIVEKMPDIKVYIAGRNMPAWFFRHSSKNLIVESNIPDSVEYQKDKAIMIVPLLSGSGLRVKILEGMSLGKTIIATTLAATGIIDKEPGNFLDKDQPVIIADTPQEFAEQIFNYANSMQLRSEVGERAVKQAAENYNIKNIGASMISFFNQILN